MVSANISIPVVAPNAAPSLFPKKVIETPAPIQQHVKQRADLTPAVKETRDVNNMEQRMIEMERRLSDMESKLSRLSIHVPFKEVQSTPPPESPPTPSAKFPFVGTS